MVNPIYVKRHIPGKGVGLVAIQNIPKGTRILSEAAFLIAPCLPTEDELLSILLNQWAAFNEHQRQELLSFHNLRPYNNLRERLGGIFITNSLPIQEINLPNDKINNLGGDSSIHRSARGGIFLEACRLNHACDANAITNWNEGLEQLNVTASKDICKDEEITISYLGIKIPRKDRQAYLKDKFAFECSCRLCSLSPKESKISDRKLNEVLRLTNLVFGRSTESRFENPLRELRELDEMVRLFKEQGTGSAALAYTLYNAAHITISYSDMARGSIFMERAISEWKIAYGSDCAEIAKWGHIPKNPSKYEYYGQSNEWRAAVDAVPTDLDPEAFEKWLWKREIRYPVEGPIDFRCRTIFLPIVDLPLPNNEDYYDANEAGSYRARLHWCFLGEITHLSKFGPSALAVNDIDGTEIRLAFYTEDGGKELPPKLLQPANTVAIINPQPYEFPAEDDSGGVQRGIRHSDELLLKV